MLDVATMEAIVSPREFHGGLAMGMLMDGVMGCRTYDGFMQVFFGLFTVVMMVFWGFSLRFHGLPLPTQPSCENQAHADASD